MSEADRLKLRTATLGSAVANLEQAVAAHGAGPMDVVRQAGMIQLFEIAWEVSWKAMREYLAANGFTEGIGSPAGAIRTAFRNGLIEDAQGWMDATKLRNTLAHEYHPQHATEALDMIARRFMTLFHALLSQLAHADIAHSHPERT